MHCGQHDLDPAIFSNGRARHLKLAEDSCRQAKPLYEFEIPSLPLRIEERCRGRVGILVDDPSRQAVVYVFWYREEVRRTLQLLRMLALERPKLVDCVVARLLDSCAGVEFGE